MVETKRPQLVDMMAIHAQSKNDPDLDPWYEGRFYGRMG
jgi:hypothetical protein